MFSCKLDRSPVQPMIKHLYLWLFVRLVLYLVHNQKWKSSVATWMGQPLVQLVWSQVRQITHLCNLWPNMENFSPKHDTSIVQVTMKNFHFRLPLGLVPLLGCNRNLKTLVTQPQHVPPLSNLWPKMEKFSCNLDESPMCSLGPNLSTFNRMIPNDTI